MLLVLKWICFIIVCLDTVSYVMEFGNKEKRGRGLGVLIGMICGITARVFVLYGTATTWLQN